MSSANIQNEHKDALFGKDEKGTTTTTAEENEIRRKFNIRAVGPNNEVVWQRSSVLHTKEELNKCWDELNQCWDQLNKQWKELGQFKEERKRNHFPSIFFEIAYTGSESSVGSSQDKNDVRDCNE